MDALGPGTEPAGTAGKVVDELLATRIDPVGIEDEYVRATARLQRSAIAQSDDGRRNVGYLTDALLEAPDLPVEHPVAQEPRTPVRCVVACEVGSAVGGSDDHARVLLCHADCVRPLLGLPVPTESGLEVLRERQVQHDVSGSGTCLRAQVGQRPSEHVTVLRVADVLDEDRLPQRRWRGGAELGVAVVVLDRVSEHLSPLRVAQCRNAVVVGQREHLHPGGDRQVELVLGADGEGAVRGTGDEDVVDRRTVGDRSVEELLRSVPCGGRRIGLVPTAEALDDDRQSRALSECDAVVLVGLVDSAHGAGGEVGDGARTCAAGRLGQCQELGAAGEPRRHRATVTVDVGRGVRGGQPGCPGGHRCAHDGLHLRHLVVGGLALGTRFAHDPTTHVGVSDVAGEVDPQASAAGVQVLGERLEVELHRVHRRGLHLLDLGEQPTYEGAIGAACGSHGEPAVAREHGRDAVVDRVGGQWVVGDLWVVVGVHVHDPRCDDEPVGVDRPGRVDGGPVGPPDVGDAAITDDHVGAATWQPGAVDHGPAADHQVPGGAALGAHRGRSPLIVRRCMIRLLV